MNIEYANLRLQFEAMIRVFRVQRLARIVDCIRDANELCSVAETYANIFCRLMENGNLF